MENHQRHFEAALEGRDNSDDAKVTTMRTLKQQSVMRALWGNKVIDEGKFIFQIAW